jgi:CubicO group peptidase (beta-lactamase class C family)
MMKKIQLLFLPFFYLQLATYAQQTDRSHFVKDSIDNYVHQAMVKWQIPGVAVCIVKDGKVVLMNAYGVKEFGKPDKVDTNTLFMIGSNTKAFTATALAMLQAQNKLSLDDRVTKYLPQFKLDNKQAGELAIVRDLLCHRLGMQTFQGDFTFYNTNLTRNEVIEKLGLIKATYPFRTKWGYTNSAFLTAGQIIPVVTEKPWEVFLKENIFTPLGMNNTIALSAEMPKALNRTSAHTLVDGQLSVIPYAQIDGIAPAGSISSSVNDLSKWVLALLNYGKVDGKEIIPQAAIMATREAQDIVGSEQHLNGETNYELYGLGWEIEDYSGHRLIMHTGGVNGYVTSVTLVPKEHLGIIILTNTDANLFYEALKWEIMDAYFKMKFRNYTDAYYSFFKANADQDAATDKLKKDTIALMQPTALPLSAYTGKYVNELYGRMTVNLAKGNGLEMHFEHHPNMYARLQSLGGNRFYVTFTDPTFGKAVFPFTVENGKVTGVRVKVADFVEYNPYDFKKVE